MNKTFIGALVALSLTAALILLGMTPASVAAFELDFGKLKSLTKKVQALKPFSEKDEIKLGNDVAATLLGAAPLVDDQALQGYVNRVGLWLALQTDRAELPWRFGVMASDAVNAFAAPGGTVLVTRGTLLRCRDEAELAGILAHEIAHVVARHALETMRKGAWAELAGDALSEYAEKRGKEDYTKLISAGTEVYTRGLDKEDEFAADRMAVVIAARAGYDPYGLAAVLQTLASMNPKDDDLALLFATHPSPQDRLAKLFKAADKPLERLAAQPRLEKRFREILLAHVKQAPPKTKQ